MYRIVEVKDRRDLMKFIKFPDELYKGCPQYVPALHRDQVASLTTVSTLSYCTHKMWMVMEGRHVVGRISAAVNPRYNERYNTRRARFGWFDTVNDIRVARMLLTEAENWAAQQGMTEIHGPLYYNTLGKQGMLVEGYDNIPPFNCLYNYPYYNDLLTTLGYVKECDWVQYKLVANHGVPDKARRVARVVEERYKLHKADVELLRKDPEMVRKFFKVYNESFASSVYNFVPLTPEEEEEEARLFMPRLSPKSACILLEQDGEIAGFGIALPSISKALQKAKGRLFPFGWLHLLMAMHNFETTDLLINGAAPKWQGKGISALYYREMADNAIKIGSRWAISNPQIETNSAVNIWNSYEREPFMRRRCYIKTIDNNG